MKTCLHCSKEIENHRKFCSVSCQGQHTEAETVSKWKERKLVGHRGVALVLKPSIRNYMLKKFNYKCSQCGWGEKHPISGNVCLEIDHIDGDASNSWEENLRVLCPNCHSITPTHRCFNKTKGKRFRKY